jgi:hypothetical protein
MARTTTCSKCDGTSFEIATISPTGGRFKNRVIQCILCGTPIAAMDYLNIGDQTEDIVQRLKRIEKMLTQSD